MPVPIIELQRRLTLVGEIRIGGEKKPRSPGPKLDAFRLTSRTRSLIEQAAQLYGGEVTPWASPSGDAWQVYTEAPEIPVLVMPSYSLTQRYELWEGATKRLRVCDGFEEELSGKTCLCNDEGVDRCDLMTRLVVALPELDTVLGWKLLSKGANAARELRMMFALVDRVAQGASFVPAQLRLDSRRGLVDGQVVRYVVPTLDLAVGYLAIAQQPPPQSLVSGAQNGEGGYADVTATSRALALEMARAGATEPRAPIEPTGTAAPMGPQTPIPEHEPPMPAPGEAAMPSPFVPPTMLPRSEKDFVDEFERTFEATEVEPQSLAVDPNLPSPEQKHALDFLVATLRDGGHIEMRKLWEAIAQLRSEDPVVMIERLDARDPDDVSRLRWSPLRDSLTKPEASQLLDWLSKKKDRIERGES